ELNRLGTWRVCTTNLAIGVCLLPVPSLVRVVVSCIGLIGLALTLVLILRAIFVMIRTKRQFKAQPAPTGKQSTTTAPAFSLRQLMASVIVVALGAGLGIGLDPSAAGWDTSSGSSSDVEPTGEVTRVEVTMANMRFTPESIDVPAGNELVIELTNTDASEVHDLTLENGVSSNRLSPGESATVNVGVVDEDIEGWCSVVGHRQMGMVFDIHAVDNAAPRESDTSADDQASSTTQGTTTDLDFQAAWSHEFEGYDPELAPASSTTTHDYTFEVTEEPIEVAPGVRQTRWTYNGDSSGPTLRGKIGDTFTITLVN